MSQSNTDRIKQYLRRQYETEEGSVEENINALFDENAVYHLGGGKTLTREAIAKPARLLRETPKSERVVRVSNFSEQGNTVSFHMHMRARGQDGKPWETDSNYVWQFNDEGKVIEVNPAQTEQLESAFRQSGVEPSESA